MCSKKAITYQLYPGIMIIFLEILPQFCYIRYSAIMVSQFNDIHVILMFPWHIVKPGFHCNTTICVHATVKHGRFFVQVYFSNVTVFLTTVLTKPMKMFRLEHETMGACQTNDSHLHGDILSIYQCSHVLIERNSSVISSSKSVYFK